MKQNILFVDDEAMVLDGLKRMLHRMRDDWDMDFADSGENALAMMRERNFDVVVADMRMPGLSGAELLADVQQNYPQTIRLILSGYADQELIMKSVGTAHQYLAKPCDPDDLKSTIERALRMKGSLGNPRVAEMVSRMEKIPSLPTLYLDIVERLKNPDADISEISETIRSDIGMTSNVLKLVNSAFFGLGRKITDTEEAISHLGIKRVRELVLIIEFFSQYQDGLESNLSPDLLWKHSMDTANLAKIILEVEGCSRKDREPVFVAGMLHDVGKLVLCSNFPDSYLDVLESYNRSGESLLKLEEDCFQSTHAEVGCYLLGLWGLDEPVVAAIGHHHLPSNSSYNEFGLSAAIHVADVLANEQSSTRPWGGAIEFEEGYLEEQGLKERLPIWREAIKENSNSL